MVTVILLALGTSVGSVISVITISDVTSAGYPTITNNATFISAILASATTCYRKEDSEGEERKEEDEGRRRRGGKGSEEEREGRGYTVPYCNLTCVNSNTKMSSRQESCKLLLCLVHVESYVMKPCTHSRTHARTHTQYPT